MSKGLGTVEVGMLCQEFLGRWGAEAGIGRGVWAGSLTRQARAQSPQQLWDAGSKEDPAECGAWEAREPGP